VRPGKPHRSNSHIRAGEQRPICDRVGRLIDPGCPDWEFCLEDTALMNLDRVPCDRCPAKKNIR